jgi:hypothetical protein
MDKIVKGTLIGWEIEAGYPKDGEFMRAAMEKRNPEFVEGVVKKCSRFYFDNRVLRDYLVSCGVKVSKVYADGSFEGVSCWEVATAPLPYGEEAFSNLELLLSILRELGCVSGPVTSAHTNVSVPGMHEWHRDEFSSNLYYHSGNKREYDMVEAFIPKCWGNYDRVYNSRYWLLSFMVGSRLDDVGLNKMFMRGGVRKVAGSTGFVSRTVLGRVDPKLINSTCESPMVKHDMSPGTARIEVRQPGGVRVLGGKPERSMQLLRKAAEMAAVAVNEGWNDYVELVDEGSSDERVKEICVQAFDRIEKMADAHMGSLMRWAFCGAKMDNGKVKYSINRYNFYIGKSMRVVGRKFKVGFWDQTLGHEHYRNNEKFTGVLVKGKTFQDVMVEADKIRKARAVRPSRSRKKVAA